MSKTQPAKAKTATPDSLGFDVIEGMLHEFRDTKKGPTLDRLTSFTEKGLAKYMAENPAAAAKKDAAVVKEALDLAKELVLDTVKLANVAMKK